MNSTDPRRGAEDPDLGRFSPALSPELIRSATVAHDGRKASVIGAYIRLQPGSGWQWGVIWMLQNLRNCPVYIFPLLTGYLIDLIDPSHPERAIQALPPVLGATFGLCIVNVMTTTIGRLMLSRINRTLTAHLRRSLIHRLNRLELTFHDRARAGEIQNKFILDTSRLEGLQQFLSEHIMMHGTTILVMLCIIAWRNPLLLVVIAAAVPINLTLARLLWKPVRRKTEAFRHAESSFLSHLSETLSGIRLSRAHATESWSEERIGRASDRVARRGIQLDFVVNLFGSSSWAVSSLLQMIVVGLGAWLAVSEPRSFLVFGVPFTLERISLGDLTVLLSYYGLVAGCIGNILNSMPTLAAAGDAIRSLSALYTQEGEADDNKTALPSLRGEIELIDVHFRYSGTTQYSLNGVALRIPAGTSLALVGASGSGKSTIASLILGFYQPDSGKVLIDGLDLTTLDRRVIRRQVGVVSQDVVLFRDSILDNIAWGDRHPDYDRACDAARQANAMEFIEHLPGGMYHLLKDRGGNLSGGQRQRLAIARALYRNPRLLILDEATSALDPESERLVQAALDILMRGRTTIVIAHRLSTIRNASNIVVLDRGKVVQQGRFDDLVNRDGLFRKLANGQVLTGTL